MEQVMVIDRKLLFSELYFTGFMPVERYDFRKKIIHSDYKWMNRNEADFDINFKQPIVYTLVYNRRSSCIFSYQISRKSNEKRLMDQWAVGVGGHVSHDSFGNQIVFINEALREILEEVIINSWVSSANIRCLGFLNLDNTTIDKVHFGIVYILPVDTGEVWSKSETQSHICAGKMHTIENIMDSFGHYTEWSRILIRYIRNYPHIL